MDSSQLRKILQTFAENTARQSLYQLEVLRTQQVNNASTSQTLGIVTKVDGASITVEYPDKTSKVLQVGNRWLSIGDITVTYGGMAH
jgi:hypothetical protein